MNNEYPKVMLVSDDKMTWKRRVVVAGNNNIYVAWSNATNIEELTGNEDAINWYHVKDIKTLKISKQDIADKYGVDIEELVITD